MEQGSVLVGTAGWEHEEYDSVFYSSAGMEGTEKLAAYARAFDAVEVRPTFWDLTLTAEDARSWVEAVGGNARFRFLVRLHRSFTHGGTSDAASRRAARAVLQELARHDRLGGVLMQFPYACTATGANRFHVGRLAEAFGGFPLFAEFRHNSWDQPWLLPFLREHGVRIVNADLPRVARLMPFLTGTIGDTAYLRLHGRNERGWLAEQWDARYDYLYNAREVREIGRRIALLKEKCIRVFVICNTTPGGKAIATAVHLSAVTGARRPVTAPARTIDAFPSLRGIALPEQAETLFSAEALRRAG